MTNIIRKRIKLYGRVQGVGFRFYACNEAKHLMLTGWVTNQPDGTVLMEVQGKDYIVNEYLIRLTKHPFAIIENMLVDSIPTIDEDSFFEM